MKPIIILLSLLSIKAFAQISEKGLPTVDGKIKFVSIVEAPGLNKGLLFTRTQAWVSQNLSKGDQNKININDSENGIISGECILGTIKNPSFKFTYTIICKDGKYKLEVENLYDFIDISAMTNRPGTWRPLQSIYDDYLKRTSKGKEGTKAEEKYYAKIRSDMKTLIIDPLEKYITVIGTDF